VFVPEEREEMGGVKLLNHKQGHRVVRPFSPSNTGKD
jgi:hypothetical protein